MGNIIWDDVSGTTLAILCVPGTTTDTRPITIDDPEWDRAMMNGKIICDALNARPAPAPVPDGGKEIVLKDDLYLSYWENAGQQEHWSKGVHFVANGDVTIGVIEPDRSKDARVAIAVFEAVYEKFSNAEALARLVLSPEYDDGPVVAFSAESLSEMRRLALLLAPEGEG